MEFTVFLKFSRHLHLSGVVRKAFFVDIKELLTFQYAVFLPLHNEHLIYLSFLVLVG